MAGSTLLVCFGVVVAVSSDPAVDAAERVNGTLNMTRRDMRFAIAAAREFAAPLREIHKPRTRHIEAWGAETKCASCLVFWPCPSARLLYSDAELAAHPEPIVAEEIQ